MISGHDYMDNRHRSTNPNKLLTRVDRKVKNAFGSLPVKNRRIDIKPAYDD
jgi:hypothetical protein